MNGGEVKKLTVFVFSQLQYPQETSVLLVGETFRALGEIFEELLVRVPRHLKPLLGDGEVTLNSAE